MKNENEVPILKMHFDAAPMNFHLFAHNKIEKIDYDTKIQEKDMRKRINSKRPEH